MEVWNSTKLLYISYLYDKTYYGSTSIGLGNSDLLQFGLGHLDLDFVTIWTSAMLFPYVATVYSFAMLFPYVATGNIITNCSSIGK